MDDIETLRASLSPEELEAAQAARVRASKPMFTNTQITDHAFFIANKAAILEAAKDGRLVNDKRRVAPAPKPAQEPAEKPTFNRSQLRDPAFFAEHKAEIMAAQRDGRVLDDKPEWKTGRKGTTR